MKDHQSAKLNILFSDVVFYILFLFWISYESLFFTLNEMELIIQKYIVFIVSKVFLQIICINITEGNTIQS